MRFQNEDSEYGQWLIQDFRRRGGNPKGGGLGYNFIKISQKLHEIQKKLVTGGGPWSPLDPPMRGKSCELDKLRFLCYSHIYHELNCKLVKPSRVAA